MENPGNYDRLQSLWENKAILDVSDYLEERTSKNESSSSVSGNSQAATKPSNSSFLERLFGGRTKTLRVNYLKIDKKIISFKCVYLI